MGQNPAPTLFIFVLFQPMTNIAQNLTTYKEKAQMVCLGFELLGW